ncbi:phage baseplate protein [Fibrobacter sp. UWH1]|uniref:phage baseplate protein n=1 Tax=Fibrobacter sp. UWH1 TaxID=1964354 RepID=UPI000B5250E0|nr:hypothetical protein [Fibrobacter sp. UWH1]OWV08681.1 hypothetical protein B7992_13235 [Fibrobacter sp. UWH1]
MIGFVSTALNIYSRYKNPPHVIAASLFTRNENFGLENLPFDLLVDESHELEFDITDHAVENGATISDHVQQKLRSVKVTGMFTNHTINGEGGFVNEDGTRNSRTWKDKVEIQEAEAVTNTALKRWEQLCAIAKARQKVRIITCLEVYEEMAIQSLHATRGAEDGESVKFELTLREIRTANFSSENLSGEWNPAEPASQNNAKQQAMSKKANAGNVSGDASESADEAVNKMNESIGREYA